MGITSARILLFFAGIAVRGDARRFFIRLARRAKTHARLRAELAEHLVRHGRVERKQPSDRARMRVDLLRSPEERRRRSLERARLENTAPEDASDLILLRAALATEEQQLASDEHLLAHLHPNHRSPAERIVRFRRETIRLIAGFLERYEPGGGSADPDSNMEGGA